MQFAFALMLAACSDSGEVTLDDSGTTTDGNGGGGGGVSADAPVVLAGDVYCYKHNTGNVAYFWVGSVQVDDPQGVDTLASPGPDARHEVNVLSGGSTVAEYGSSLVCDDLGECSLTWQESWDNVRCASADSYTIEFIITDEDGNESAAFEVTGRQAAGADG